ncbi:immunity protein YezG family protein [Alkalicoccobacillus murimartini]|uniref:DUF600 family protein n=1 Tax=Alkalicoccobacillus murimartini TaxID=171685 RepID=A0ABT9YGJ7_9BACI|nr:immunity protein YezG family protein [Alkalicoccobacillus murimartini]MDQ0206980.1 hypothetical protein [Alkalicoccobacillus murimartini]
MESKNMERIYQKITNNLVNTIPEDWMKTYLYAEYREGFKTVFFYYYPLDGGKPVYSLNIPDLYNVTENDFDNMKNELYMILTDLWNEFNEQDQEQWTHLTFILDNTGKMKIDYGHENLFGISAIDKKRNWEAKYLT